MQDKISRETMLEQLRSLSGSPEKITAIMEKEKVNCREVLDLCLPVMSSFSGEPEEGWLEYIYSFLLKQLFPEKNGRKKQDPYRSGRLFYLEALRHFLLREIQTKPFNPLLHMELLTEPEYSNSGTAVEYRCLLERIQADYLCEFMRLGAEVTRHKTLAHIAGVHYVCMHVGKQLREAGVPVDIALLSGAAFGHDIGKYGCRPEESKRIPYLHYYYTDQYFKRNRMPAIGHIAANHSTWDLELENLSVESLVLIYADFRVKNEKGTDGREVVAFFSLEDSFQVILDKLDNVDEAKRDRYCKVYAKLEDFEQYIKDLGVNTDLTVCRISRPEKKDVSLFTPEEAVRSLKNLAIRHNIFVMHQFNAEDTFQELIEAARSERNWRITRAYLNIFREYDTYLTQQQKLLTMDFLYELLMHREGDIRRQSAELMGRILIRFDSVYRKELPAGVKREPDEVTGLDLWKRCLAKIIQPDSSVTEQHRRWLGYTLKLIVSYVLAHCSPQEVRNYLAAFLVYYEEENRGDAASFFLLDSIYSLPLSGCTPEEKQMLMGFAAGLARRESLEIRAAVLRFFWCLAEDPACGQEFRGEILSKLDLVGTEGAQGLSLLAERIRSILEPKRLHSTGRIPESKRSNIAESVLSDTFLENLKAATPWIIKIINLDLLLGRIVNSGYEQLLQTAAHLSNLLKVSEQVAVRHKAGQVLLSVVPQLPLDQRNEIVVELSKGLEIGEYEFSKYIPEYLGQLALFLHPNELDELILDFKKLLSGSSDRICSLTLDTLGIMLQHYSSYPIRFPEDEANSVRRKETISGLLLRGLSSYRDAVRQEALLVIGQYLFESPKLNQNEKYEIFSFLHKKILTLISDHWKTDISFFSGAASLNHMYRFILGYQFDYGTFRLPVTEKVAFFPGSFDPFSLGHKGVISGIRDLGFEVYLAIDEFFWLKKTQPKMIRRQIINMSVAEEKDVYLFPDEIPVNIGNPSDLKRLKDLFPGRNLYIAVGEDVLEKADSYRAPQEEGSVHHFPHIIFSRPDAAGSDDSDACDAGVRAHAMISGEVQCFTLPSRLDEIDSVRIRENIDSDRDISNLIDPMVQRYISENSLYLREPLFKHEFEPGKLETEEEDSLDKAAADELNTVTDCWPEDTRRIQEALYREDTRTVLLRNRELDDIVVGILTYYEFVRTGSNTSQESSGLSARIKSQLSGRVMVITGIATDRKCRAWEAEQLLLTDALAYGLKKGFRFAVFVSERKRKGQTVLPMLKRYGFQPFFQDGHGLAAYAVSLEAPVAYISDLGDAVKGPFHRCASVQNAISAANQNLQRALTKLYPGHLIFFFQSDLMNQKIVRMAAEVSRSEHSDLDGACGAESMCVPFGKILRGVTLPDVVTKSLWTEKRFEQGTEKFKISEYPYYSPLQTQIRAVKSFRRPVILVDDLIDEGYYVKELDPLFLQEEVEIRKIIVGILSGKGREMMRQLGRTVDCVYDLPHLHAWFLQSVGSPFLGGDGLWQREITNAGFIPSINQILPYTAPDYTVQLKKNIFYDFSLTCLENTYHILQTLEAEYQTAFERKLTLRRLSEAVISPRYPEKGSNIHYDMDTQPSIYVENDIEHLLRLRNMISKKNDVRKRSE